MAIYEKKAVSCSLEELYRVSCWLRVYQALPSTEIPP